MLCSIDRSNLSFAASNLSHDLGFNDQIYGYGAGKSRAQCSPLVVLSPRITSIIAILVCTLMTSQMSVKDTYNKSSQ